MNDQMTIRLNRALHTMFDGKASKFELYRAKLETLNPLSVMEKGFAVISKNQKVITSIKQIKLHEDIELRLKDGYAVAEIKELKEK